MSVSVLGELGGGHNGLTDSGALPDLQQEDPPLLEGGAEGTQPAWTSALQRLRQPPEGVSHLLPALKEPEACSCNLEPGPTICPPCILGDLFPSLEWTPPPHPAVDCLARCCLLSLFLEGWA